MADKNTGTGAELARILKELGNSADEVAASLQAKGVKGVRKYRKGLESHRAYVQGQVKVDAPGLDVIKGDRLRFFFHHQKKRGRSFPSPGDNEVPRCLQSGQLSWNSKWLRTSLEAVWIAWRGFRWTLPHLTFPAMNARMSF